jgi:hypothetical protein
VVVRRFYWLPLTDQKEIDYPFTNPTLLNILPNNHAKLRGWSHSQKKGYKPQESRQL